jgi:hypothetical protein
MAGLLPGRTRGRVWSSSSDSFPQPVGTPGAQLKGGDREADHDEEGGQRADPAISWRTRPPSHDAGRP